MTDGNGMTDMARILVVGNPGTDIDALRACFGADPLVVVAGSPSDALRILAERTLTAGGAEMVHVLPRHEEMSALASRLADEEALAALRREGVEAILRDGVIYVAEGLADRVELERRIPPMRICADAVESLGDSLARTMAFKGELRPHQEKDFYRRFEKRRPDGSVKRGRR